MLVGRGLERLDRSRSHHILSQEEVIVILCANNINLGEEKLLFVEFQCQTLYYGLTEGWVQKFKASYLAYFLH